MFPAISRDATYSRPVCGESFCILWLRNDGAYRLFAQFSLNQQAVLGGKRTVWLGIWNRILYFIDPVALD